MFEWINFLKALLIGLSIAAPVGPIGVLCIRRTLLSGRAVGLASGMGAATADAFYGAVAAFGLTFISGFLVGQQIWLRLLGGAFLCWLGIKTFLSQPAPISGRSIQAGMLGAYASTFLLTLANPLTILSFAAVYAGLGVVPAQGSYYIAAITVLGVFLGSSSWWLFLSTTTSLFSRHFSSVALRWVNRLSGLLIFGFGLAALVFVFS